ncbi:unnamed protein product [Dicrocoelium dendriticum]|nr:unnamed protein product [Dicrocoelium dendriticum]
MSDNSADSYMQYVKRSEHVSVPIHCSHTAQNPDQNGSLNGCTTNRTVESSGSFGQTFPAPRETKEFAIQTGYTSDVALQTDPPVRTPVVIQRYQFYEAPEQVNTSQEIQQQQLGLRVQLLMDRLPLRELTSEEVERLHRCLVCMDEYIIGSRVMTLPCFHLFHETCARRWFEDFLTCPVCRSGLLLCT